jgi:GxxExxY protein
VTADPEPAFERDPLTEAVIGCVFRVATGLGTGFLQKVSENALLHELRKSGLEAKPQVAVPVHYDGQNVGDYIGDTVVEGRLLLELKAVKALEDVHLAQCLNYLKATGIPTCLLINFGTSKPQIRRVSR